MGTLLNDLEPDEDDNGDGDWKDFLTAYIIGMLIAIAIMGALIWPIAKLIVS